MALWGNKDDKTSTGTVQVFANGLITGSSTLFDTEAKVNDYIVTSGGHVKIKTKVSNTNVQVVAANLGTSVNAVAAGAAYTLNEKPTFVGDSEVKGDVTKVFGVDTTEAGVTDTTHAGWVRRTAGSGGRSGRVHFEVLVAGSSIAGDAADDTQLADS
jgi:hypothetical protein